MVPRVCEWPRSGESNHVLRRLFDAPRVNILIESILNEYAGNIHGSCESNHVLRWLFDASGVNILSESILNEYAGNIHGS